MPRAKILGPPAARGSLTNGVATLNRLLALTLGPHTGKIAVENGGTRPPERHDDALTISQRVLDLPNPFEDMGCQILRRALTHVGTQSHDGAATCAALAHAILRSAEPILASGYDANRFIHEVLDTKTRIIARLVQRAEAISSKEAVESVLRSAFVESRLAMMVAEIMDTVGPEGAVLVEETRLPNLAHEYVPGGRWIARPASPYFLRSNELIATASEPLIVVAAAPLLSVDYVLPALDAAASTKTRSLVMVAPKFSDQVIGALLLNRERGVLNAALALTAPSSIHYGPEILEDIGVLVGAGSTGVDATPTPNRLQAVDFGQASQVWASMSAFGIMGGRGEKELVSARVRTIRMQAATEQEAVKRRKLSERMGTLLGISAIIRAPDRTASFDEDGVKCVEKAVAIARHALQEGVLPGAGAALAHCAAEFGVSDALPIGSQVLLRALREPMSIILENSGVVPGLITEQVPAKDWHQAYDVLRGEWVNTHETGLLDTLAATRVALDTAVSMALMIVSTDTLVSRKAAQNHA